MTTYTGHRVEDHEDFILEQLLPLIVDHAGASDTPTEVVTFAALLTLATILQARGWTVTCWCAPSTPHACSPTKSMTNRRACNDGPDFAFSWRSQGNPAAPGE